MRGQVLTKRQAEREHMSRGYDRMIERNTLVVPPWSPGGRYYDPDGEEKAEYARQVRAKEREVPQVVYKDTGPYYDTPTSYERSTGHWYIITWVVLALLLLGALCAFQGWS